ncbi:hypothetical protein ACQP1K_09110 [Sphaerimonospora sp. CA-214678]|uniref:hypothetical protein n=1 Tax=Sphaerimonospora sp. CA-214678 TaxID=3240029 RepID=UPI003D8A302B
MTFTAMQPSYMTTTPLGYATQQQISPLQLGQLTQQPGQQQALSISQSTRQEEQIHPQEHLVSPRTFWARIARVGIRHGVPAARQVLETVLYQQAAQQHAVAPQIAQLGMAMPQLAGQQASLLNGTIQQEEQVHPQEHLVSPQTFWTKVARMTVRHGVEVARQILDVLQTQHQVEQQIQEQAVEQVLRQQIQQQLANPYAQGQYQPQYGQALGLQAVPQHAQAYGQHLVPQIALNPLNAINSLGAVNPLNAINSLGGVNPLAAMNPLSAVSQQQYGQQQYGQQVSPQYVTQQHQQAAQQTPVAAGAGF